MKDDPMSSTRQFIVDEGLFDKKPKSQLSYETASNLLKTIREYRDYAQPDSPEWEDYILDFFHILGFQTAEIERRLFSLAKLGEQETILALAVPLMPDNDMDEIFPGLAWSSYLRSSNQDINARWGIVINGMEIKIMDLYGDDSEPHYFWSNIDGIISEERMDSFFTLCHVFSSIKKAADTFSHERNVVQRPSCCKRGRKAAIEFHRLDSCAVTVKKLVNSSIYKYFQSVSAQKHKNEQLAKQILSENTGKIASAHIKRIFALVDTPYTSKLDNRPWFGRLIKLNGQGMLEENEEKINLWFNYLLGCDASIEERIDTLRTPSSELHISGASAGLVTLFLYLMDSATYSIWFKGQNEGLSAFYKTDTYQATGQQYVRFNKAAKEFAHEFGFKDYELDFIFSTIEQLTGDE